MTITTYSTACPSCHAINEVFHLANCFSTPEPARCVCECHGGAR